MASGGDDGGSSRGSGRPQFVLRGHKAAVNTVSFVSVNQQMHILSGSQDGIVKLWDLTSRRARTTFAAHDGSVLQATLLSGFQMITQEKGGTIHLWDCASELKGASPSQRSGHISSSTTPQKIQTFDTRSYGFCRCASKEQSGKRMLLTASDSRSKLLLWDLKSSKPIQKISLTTGREDFGLTTHVSFLGNDSMDTICWGSESGHIGFYSLTAARSIAKGTLEKQPVMSVSCLPSKTGALGFAGGALGEITAFSVDFNQGKVETHQKVKYGDKGISEVKIRHDSRIFATAGWDHRVRIFNSKSMEQLAILKYHSQSVFCVDFGPSSEGFVASGSKDSTIAVFKVYPSKKKKKTNKTKKPQQEGQGALERNPDDVSEQKKA